MILFSFDDEEVLSEDFAKKVGDVVEALAPLVLLLNEMTHPQSENEEEEAEEEPSEHEQAEVTAASGQDPEDAKNDEGPVEEKDQDGMEGNGGIEEA